MGEVISFVLCHLDGKRSSGVFGGGGGVYFGGIWGPWGIFDRFGIGDITLHLHSGGIWGVFERSEMGPVMPHYFLHLSSVFCLLVIFGRSSKLK